MSAATARWRAIAGDRIDWRRWDDGSGDDDFVVFNDLTADTHQLSGDAGAVLIALIGSPSPCTPEELLVRVAGAARDSTDAAAYAALDAILAGLEHIGLASRVAA